MTSSTTTVALSFPPASLARRTKASAAWRGIACLGQDVGDLFGGHLVGEPVRAEQEAVAFFGDELPDVDGHLGLDSERPGEDVAMGVDRRLLLRQLAARHELLGHRMVGGELDQAVAVQAVGPRVPDIGEHQPVTVVGGDQSRRDHGGAHAPEVHILVAAFPHRLVGVVDGGGQPFGGGLAGELGLQGLDGGARRDLAADVTSHPVRHGEQGEALEREVLVDRAHPTHVGGRTRPEDGQRPSVELV